MQLVSNHRDIISDVISRDTARRQYFVPRFQCETSAKRKIRKIFKTSEKYMKVHPGEISDEEKRFHALSWPNLVALTKVLR